MSSRATTSKRSWTTASVAEVASILDSRRVPLNAAQRAARPGPYPYYGANGQVDTIDDYLFDGDYVLLAEDGGFFDDPTRPVAYRATGKIWVNNHAHILQPKKGVLVPYLLNALNAVDWMPYVSGTTRLKLTQKSLQRVRINIPPTNEQSRIVAKIEALTARSRRAREALAAIPPLLEKLRQSILAAAFRGDLTAEWRAQHPDVEPASELLKRIRIERRRRWEEGELAKMKAKGKVPKDDRWKKKYKDPEPVDTEGLPELPEGWEWAKVDDIADVGTGATPKRSNSKYWSDGTVPWITSGALNSSPVEVASAFTTEAALRETNLNIYPPGTLLLAMYGEGRTRGTCAELGISATTNQAIAAIVLSSDAEQLRTYLRLFLQFNYERTRESAAGGVQPNLNLSVVRNIVFPLPPAVEREVICDVVVRALENCQALDARVLGAIEEQTLLGSMILAKAFRGELVPQDRTDEPASALLQRIREEPGANPPAKTQKRPQRRGKELAPGS